MKNTIIVIAVVAIIGIGVYALARNMNSDENGKGVTNKNWQNSQVEENQAEENMETEEAISAELEDGDYTVEPSSSSISWYAAKVVGDHAGSVEVKSGSLSVQDSQLSDGMLVVNMTSIETDEDIARLESHLKSEDFFNVEAYPEASLDIKSISMQDNGTYLAQADLTIKGQTNEVTLPMQAYQEADAVKIVSTFSIDRTKWDIRFRSGKFFQDLGDNMIYDDIDFLVELTARK
jgi:polyisoprenoid-binding protein YceI